MSATNFYLASVPLSGTSTHRWQTPHAPLLRLHLQLEYGALHLDVNNRLGQTTARRKPQNVSARQCQVTRSQLWTI